MTDIMNVTPPQQTRIDSPAHTNNQQGVMDPRIENVANPDRVNRPDGQTVKQNPNYEFRPDSNFEGFVRAFRNSPQLLEMFTKLIFMDSATIISSGLSAGFAEELSKFMDMMNMNPEQLLEFMKSQGEDSSRFSGVFFQALKEVFDQTQSVDLKASLLEFAKKYSDMASSAHLLENIKIETEAMIPYLLKKDGEILKELLSHLETFTGTKEDRGSYMANLGANIQKNSNVILKELLPFFSKYIEKTHDMGKPRQYMTLLTHNISRYINGRADGVLNSFLKLLQFGDFKQKFTGLEPDHAELILNNLLLKQNEEKPRSWVSSMVDILRNGMTNYENRAVFMNIMNSLLLNDSVYMPLMHLMLPVVVDGHTMFSELWVDPDSEDSSSDPAGKRKRNIRMLVKFDIKDVGFFDVLINYCDGRVDLQIAYPENLAAREPEIRAALGDILKENGLDSRSLTMEKGGKPMELMKVFPKLALRRSEINVRI